MKTVRVIKQFHDKDNFAKVYSTGDVVQFEETRANSLMSLGLVEQVKPLRNKIKVEET